VPDVKSKKTVHESPVFKQTNPNPITIKQDLIYHKQALHRAGIWRSKSENPPEIKVETEQSESANPGKWMDLIMSDVDGKPKSVRAWVPNQN